MKTASSTVALLSGDAKTHELMGTQAVSKIAKDQAAVTEHRKALRQTARRATNALVKLGQDQIVLGHIQPRWLRAQVTRLLDFDEEVTPELLTQLREAGREEAEAHITHRLRYRL